MNSKFFKAIGLCKVEYRGTKKKEYRTQSCTLMNSERKMAAQQFYANFMELGQAFYITLYNTFTSPVDLFIDLKKCTNRKNYNYK